MVPESTLFESHGMTVDCNINQVLKDAKQPQCRHTYGTNNEFGFDYLEIT
jgi:preprotein translocase subunit SecA